ncbi:WecB/TagA/CpsF family glycosyltransferase [Brevundimonas sp.]|uniref:WecB/TagA/CpsF family glycosyltransferase n=1 Tax=Brevundimonas sp. TaxID=1871086 RepID=UPI0025C575B4|nr:WecB/TagA/CpsF family glycosyltransferase [Brevundimonas sp.]MCG2665104.1 WecB/TagA/CpsF family glycosyltransferase [Brevundimonas sp.]
MGSASGRAADQSAAVQLSGESGAVHAKNVPHVRIGGVRAALLSRSDLVQRMLEEAPEIQRARGRARLVFDVNGHAISMAAQDAQFKAALEIADIVHADGGVIVAASRLISGGGIPDRSATTDLYDDCLHPAAMHGVSLFLLGGRPGVAQTCATLSKARAPGLNIVGTRHGYFCDAEEAAIVDEINAAQPDVLWVGLGKPKEQAFCLRHKDKLRCGWLVTCGGLFNYVTGDYPRAPRWMQRSGLEWVHRLATNPRHLLWRYLTTNPHALWLIATRTGY